MFTRKDQCHKSQRKPSPTTLMSYRVQRLEQLNRMLRSQTTVSPLSFVHLPPSVGESAQLAELLVHQADAHSLGRSSVYSPVGAVEGSWSG